MDEQLPADPADTPVAAVAEEHTQIVKAGRERRWKPAKLTWAIVISGFLGLAILLYPTAASWLTQYNQSQITRDYDSAIQNARPSAEEQLQAAAEYNEALTAGVKLEAGANVPTGAGTSDSVLNYDQLLAADKTGLMARIMIPSIDVDMPIYHGTDDDTLLRGVGHLEGSHLPIGGDSTHSVLTAHRGLASARMFTDLDQVNVGDTFTIEVFGEVLTYRVKETRVVEPDDTDSLLAVQGEDLVTLITCTPLGINTHRILVTGERVAPTPRAELTRVADGPQVPRFPWWILIGAAGTGLLGTYLWRAGYADQLAATRPRK